MGLRTFTFAGTASSTYDLFIVEAAPYNAPPRSVEMIEIPGRNGAYALDKGCFENIEVTYHVCVSKDTKANFQTEISNVRNWLCSKVGYQRLTDDYNPNEYRMAIYKSGLESDELFWNGAEFDITFECKPQRWLTSGETAVSVSSGNTITNPTLFDSRPQLQVWGYGDISFNNSNIGINVGNVPLGNIQIASATNNTGLPFASNILGYLLNTGDSFTISGANITTKYSGSSSRYEIAGITLGGATDCSTSKPYLNQVKIQPDDVTFIKGTASTKNFSAGYVVSVYNLNNGTTTSTTVTFSGSIAYDGNDTITYSATITSVSATKRTDVVVTPDIFADSTLSALGTPLYIDFDIGEAYKIENGVAVSCNDAVTIPAELPTLPSGVTTITYDNTFTKVDIVPRWWKV